MKHRLRDVIGSALIGAFVLALFALFWKEIPSANEQLLSYMLGQLSGFAAGIVAYHYATNAQSQQATENTGAAMRAIEAAAKAGVTNVDDDAIQSGDQVEVRKA